MSTKPTTRHEGAGTDRSEEQRIKDVRYLEAGDEVRLNGREKPLTVTGTDTRTQETMVACRSVTQHLVELEGEWADATTYAIANVVDAWSGVELPEQRALGDGPTGAVELALVEMEGL